MPQVKPIPLTFVPTYRYQWRRGLRHLLGARREHPGMLIGPPFDKLRERGASRGNGVSAQGDGVLRWSSADRGTRPVYRDPHPSCGGFDTRLLRRCYSTNGNVRWSSADRGTRPVYRDPRGFRYAAPSSLLLNQRKRPLFECRPRNEAGVSRPVSATWGFDTRARSSRATQPTEIPLVECRPRNEAGVSRPASVTWGFRYAAPSSLLLNQRNPGNG